MQARLEQIISQVTAKGNRWLIFRAQAQPMLGVELRKNVPAGPRGRGGQRVAYAYVILVRGDQFELQVVDDASKNAGFAPMLDYDPTGSDADLVKRILGAPHPFSIVLEPGQKPAWDTKGLGMDVAFPDDDDV